MTTNSHIIQQQYLHVEVNGAESDAWVLQNQLSGWCRDNLLPALEKVFNRFAESESWCIDRLDIDAGELRLAHLEQDLALLVAEAVEKKLHELAIIRPSSTPTTDNIRRKTNQQSLIDALVYFLNTGQLPWSMQLPKGKNFEQLLLDTWQNTAITRTQTAIIVNELRAPIAIKRLVKQFSPLLMRHLLSTLSPEGKKIIDLVLPRLQDPNTPPITVKAFEKQLWETLFTFIATGKIITETAVISEIWQTLNLPATQELPLKNLLSPYGLAAIETTSNHPASSIKQENPVLANVSINQQPESPIDSNADHQQIANAVNQNRNELIIDPNAKTPSISQLVKPIFEATDIKEGIYIENAGLILLHPFLPQFFTALAIAKEDQLIQPERALCLLHFLTTGLLIAPEYEVTLAKVLCNIPLDTPVESDMGLSELELEEAKALLDAVIHHWDALRNTSIDGLRGEFLLRFGKLSVRNDGDWLLQIENKTADILLNQLPWGISMIKLPWMQRMLWVEWDY